MNKKVILIITIILVCIFLFYINKENLDVLPVKEYRDSSCPPPGGDPNRLFINTPKNGCVRLGCKKGYVDVYNQDSVKSKCTLIGSTCPTPVGGVINSSGQCEIKCQPGYAKNTMQKCIQINSEITIKILMMLHIIKLKKPENNFQLD